MEIGFVCESPQPSSLLARQQQQQERLAQSSVASGTTTTTNYYPGCLACLVLWVRCVTLLLPYVACPPIITTRNYLSPFMPLSMCMKEERPQQTESHRLRHLAPSLLTRPQNKESLSFSRLPASLIFSNVSSVNEKVGSKKFKKSIGAVLVVSIFMVLLFTKVY